MEDLSCEVTDVATASGQSPSPSGPHPAGLCVDPPAAGSTAHLSGICPVCAPRPSQVPPLPMCPQSPVNPPGVPRGGFSSDQHLRNYPQDRDSPSPGHPSLPTSSPGEQREGHYILGLVSLSDSGKSRQVDRRRQALSLLCGMEAPPAFRGHRATGLKGRAARAQAEQVAQWARNQPRTHAHRRGVSSFSKTNAGQRRRAGVRGAPCPSGRSGCGHSAVARPRAQAGPGQEAAAPVWAERGAPGGRATRARAERHPHLRRLRSSAAASRALPRPRHPAPGARTWRGRGDSLGSRPGLSGDPRNNVGGGGDAHVTRGGVPRERSPVSGARSERPLPRFSPPRTGQGAGQLRPCPGPRAGARGTGRLAPALPDPRRPGSRGRAQGSWDTVTSPRGGLPGPRAKDPAHPPTPAGGDNEGAAQGSGCAPRLST